MIAGLSYLLAPGLIFARITPEDIINAKQEVYEKTVVRYSLQHQQRLRALSQKVADLNQQRSSELEGIIKVQGDILEEYRARHPEIKPDQLEKVGYWLTFAHEAVAYQKAKIYIYELTQEPNIRSDAQKLVNRYINDLESTRQKVIHSQQVMVEAIR